MSKISHRNSRIKPTLHASTFFNRKGFMREGLGRAITALIVLAAAIHDETDVDRLLVMKDCLDRGR